MTERPLKTKVQWSYSSVGSEHLPYKQRVLGSNPSETTSRDTILSCLFLFPFTEQSFMAFIESSIKRSHFVSHLATDQKNVLILTSFGGAFILASHHNMVTDTL